LKGIKVLSSPFKVSTKVKSSSHMGNFNDARVEGSPSKRGA
jgi:hypothetical protein